MNIRVLIEINGVSVQATAFENGSQIATARSTSVPEAIKKVKTRVLDQIDEVKTWEIYDLEGKEYS